MGFILTLTMSRENVIKARSGLENAGFDCNDG